MQLVRPAKPTARPRIRLRVGDGSADLRFQLHHGDVGVNVLNRSGEVEVLVTK